MTTLKKADIEKALKGASREEATERLNELISPNQKLESGQSCQLSEVIRSSEYNWTEIAFPHWVELEEADNNTVSFKCDEMGRFVSW